MNIISIEDEMNIDEFINHVNEKHGFRLGWQEDYNPSRGYHKYLHDTAKQDHEHNFREKETND